MSVVTSFWGRASSLLVLLYLVLASCQPLSTGGIEAISSRPQSWTKFIAMVRLKGAPLLETASRDDEGRPVIDTEQKTALLADQERVIAELQALSSEVVVIYRHYLLVNALSIIAPESIREQVEDLEGVSVVENTATFRPPEMMAAADESNEQERLQADSAAFIGSRKVHTLRVPNRDGVPVPVRGEGIRVAIIDTGIDYTHKMFGGTGNVEDYKKNDPTVIEEYSFPTRKVIAGIDLVGADYDSTAGEFARQVPRGDADPLDEGMHGTHVAGTVAGVGDGVNTHDGVAPDALLMAIKVFGGGSTSEPVIIRALEYALDPNGDFNFDDSAHVANLSLGAPYGTPGSLYGEALTNALRGGMAVVASAGNYGPEEHIVSDPSASNDAISVGASIDDGEHNWKLPAIKISGGEGRNIMAEIAESPMSKPIAELEELSASLYYIGLADKDLSAEQQEGMRGKVALIDRGVVTFVEKINRAVAAGAVGVVVINNVEGRPIRMGGAVKYQIPAVMISKSIGADVRGLMQDGAVRVAFSAEIFLERRELIDTIAYFSSYGPRSFDYVIKPEIIAPGVLINSAYSGHGDRGIRINGTSMAAPHISGTLALLRQYRPNLDTALLKGMLVAKAKIIRNAAGERYQVSQQGGGRVDAFAAATAEAIFHPATLSLGQTTVASSKRVAGHFSLQNLSEKDMELTLHTDTVKGLTFSMPERVTLAAGTQTRVDFELLVAADGIDNFYTSMDGWIEARNSEQVVARLPLLLGVKKLARVQPLSATVHARSLEDSYRAIIDVELSNAGTSSGEALFFNLLAVDERLSRAQRVTRYLSDVCDLQSAGYRIIEQMINGKREKVLQFAAKLHYPMTTWHNCALSVQFDADGDGVADQELIGDSVGSFMAGHMQSGMMFSALLDAHKMREIRHNHELSGRPANYTQAIVSFLPLNAYGHSTLMVASVRLADVARDSRGDLRVRLAVEYGNSEDYLADHKRSWQTIVPTIDGMGFWGMPDSVLVTRDSKVKASLSRGGDPAGQLVAYFPHNASTFSTLRYDHQSDLVELSYRP